MLQNSSGTHACQPEQYSLGEIIWRSGVRTFGQHVSFLPFLATDVSVYYKYTFMNVKC